MNCLRCPWRDASHDLTENTHLCFPSPPSLYASCADPVLALCTTPVHVTAVHAKSKRQSTRVLINYDKKHLQQLVSCVERALQKSPSDPPVRVTSLSYAPVETTGGEGGSVLEGTPFCPQPKRQKWSIDAGQKYVLLTQETFNPEVFWAMEKVFLAAVVVREVCLRRYALHADWAKFTDCCARVVLLDCSLPRHACGCDRSIDVGLMLCFASDCRVSASFALRSQLVFVVERMMAPPPRTTRGVSALL